MNRDILNTNSGFTLVEVMVSMLLLSMVLGGGMNLFFVANSFLRNAVDKRIVTEMLNSSLESMKAVNYSSLPSAAGSPHTTTITVGDLAATENITVTEIDDPVGGGTDYKQVNISIAWLQTGKVSPRNINLTTYIAP